jgi:hypothetical protein
VTDQLTILDTLALLKRLDIPMSRASLYRRIADAGFPKPVAFTGTKKLWSRREVEAWAELESWAALNHHMVPSVAAMTEREAVQWAAMNSGFQASPAKRKATSDALMSIWQRIKASRFANLGRVVKLDDDPVFFTVIGRPRRGED